MATLAKSKPVTFLYEEGDTLQRYEISLRAPWLDPPSYVEDTHARLIIDGLCFDAISSEIRAWLESKKEVESALLRYCAGTYTMAVLVDSLSENTVADIYSNADRHLSGLKQFSPRILVLGPNQRWASIVQSSQTATVYSREASP